jgi:hypothetical protein
MHHIGINKVQVVGKGTEQVSLLGLLIELQEVIMLCLIQMLQEEGLEAELRRRRGSHDVGMFYIDLGS